MAGTVRHVYDTQIVRVVPSTMLSDVEAVLLSGHGDEAYVVDDDGRLLGLVPDYELLKLRMLNLQEVGAAVDIMTPSPPTVTLDTPLEEAACHLRVHVHRSLPVLDDGILVGRVKRRSILCWYADTAGAGSETDASAQLQKHSTPARPKFLQTVPARSTPVRESTR